MAIGIRLTPLIVIVQAIRPDVSSSTVDLRTGSIPRLEQSGRARPVVRRAPLVECSSLANAQCVRDLVHGCTFIHVGTIRTKPEVAVEVGLGGGHAWLVVDADGLVGAGVAVVAGDGETHGRIYAVVRVLLVGGGIAGSDNGPVQGCRGG